MESPCYNTKTKTDCPRRKAGCAVNCPEWAKYTQERNKEYHERQVQNDIEQTLRSSTAKHANSIQRRRIRNHWTRKNFKG